MSQSTHLHQTNFVPNPIQRQFIESRAKADLYSSRMGEGKSTALAWAVLYHTRHNPGARWVMLRDTWENMSKTTQKTFFEWFPPGIYGTYHHTSKTFTWASGVAKGEVEFTGMDDPKDASKLMSKELAGIAVDEPAPAVGSAGIDELIFDLGLSRLRQPGMNWYSFKLAENNPDESHWTYRRFQLEGNPDFMLWQPAKPENEANLPPEYYANLRKMWVHRPDLVRRFVEGEFGFQIEGKQVTPQWSDKNHLATGLYPLKGVDLHLLWDFGLNPTCIITQKTPMGEWHILESFVGDEVGAEELIVDYVKPSLVDRYRKRQIHHIGDPAGQQREQSSSRRSAVLVLKKAIGGTWRAGPVKTFERIEPLRAVLMRQGLVKVDRHRAKEVWFALRGGWHFHVARTGLVSGEPYKNIHSHPGDAMGYGAAILFPLGRIIRGGLKEGAMPQEAHYWNRGPLGFEKPGLQIPKQGDKLIIPG